MKMTKERQAEIKALMLENIKSNEVNSYFCGICDVLEDFYFSVEGREYDQIKEEIQTYIEKIGGFYKHQETVKAINDDNIEKFTEIRIELLNLIFE